MSLAVTLAEAKLHLRVINSLEDTLIQLYIDAAEGWVANYIDDPIPGVSDSPAEAAPTDIKAAILLIVGDLFQNREGASEKEIKENPAVIRLLYPYRNRLGI